MIASAIGVRPRADGVVSKKPRGLLVDIMVDRFLVVRFDDGNPVATPHSTSADALGPVELGLGGPRGSCLVTVCLDKAQGCGRQGEVPPSDLIGNGA